MPLLFVTYPLPENFFQLHRLPLRASDTQVQDSLYARTVRPTTTLLPFLPPKSPQVHSRRRVSRCPFSSITVTYISPAIFRQTVSLVCEYTSSFIRSQDESLYFYLHVSLSAPRGTVDAIFATLICYVLCRLRRSMLTSSITVYLSTQSPGGNHALCTSLSSSYMVAMRWG